MIERYNDMLRIRAARIFLSFHRYIVSIVILFPYEIKIVLMLSHLPVSLQVGVKKTIFLVDYHAFLKTL
jgi:hypothetical protein